MYTPNRSPGFFDNVRNPDNLRKVPSFDPESKNILSIPGYFDSYPPIYAPRIGIDYTQNYVPNMDFEVQEDFPSLLTSKPPGFMNEDFYPPPGFSKPLKTKAPNPNAVSFIPSHMSAPPIKAEKEELELKEFGIRGILTLQKNLQDDKALLAKGRDLNTLEVNKKNAECLSSYMSTALDNSEIAANEYPEYWLPKSFHVTKPILKAKFIKTFTIETLLYAFYNMPGESIQSYVADELYKRDWLYDPGKQLWCAVIEGEWKIFDISRFEIVPSQNQSGPFLSKEEVSVKHRPLA